MHDLIARDHMVSGCQIANGGFLGHVGDPQRFHAADTAAIWLKLPKQHGEQARLSRTVGPNKRNLLPGL